MTRRTFSSMLVSAGGALVAGIVGVPAIITGLSPAIKNRRRENWRQVGLLDEFPVRQIRTVFVRNDSANWPRPLSQQAVFVWRQESDELIVFSRSCTDLACPLTYDPGSECFLCPCHGGIFSKEGTVMAGPPNRPMDRYNSRLRDGMIEIDFASVTPSS
jgi:menaquinol-cytochrome c reductase iron-sulfur subunit